jgi:nucleoside-diphosphate-sugar epimerase
VAYAADVRIFVAGATGVIGVRVVPLLVAAGHDVAGLTRSQSKAASITAMGAQPFVMDVYDASGLASVVTTFRPDVVLHELTDLPDDSAALASFVSANARIRVEGTRNLLGAARLANTQRFLAQSIAWALPAGAGADAVAELERSVIGFGGTVLRYGQFYGPGTFHPDTAPSQPRVHIDTAARRTVEAIDLPSGVVTIIDTDEG